MTGDGASLCPHQILQVLAHRLLIAKIVMVLHQAVEQRLVGRPSDLLQLRSAGCRSSAQSSGVVSISIGCGRSRRARGLGGRKRIRGQLDLPGAVQHQQQATADHIA